MTKKEGSPDLASSLVLGIKEGSVSRAVLGRALRRRVEIGSFLFVFCGLLTGYSSSKAPV